MERLLTVKGIGKISLPPDRIEVSLTLHARKKEYEEAVLLAEESLAALQQAVASAGIRADELKTASFSVNTEYESVQDKSGRYRQQFIGYLVQHGLVVRFAMDMTLLGNVLGAVAAAKVNPELQIRFTLEDSGKAAEEMLLHASKDAAEKARLLAQASGVTLGQLVQIDYDWSEVSFYSPTSYQRENAVYGAKLLAMDLTPENITQSDTVRFVWAIG